MHAPCFHPAVQPLPTAVNRPGPHPSCLRAHPASSSSRTATQRHATWSLGSSLGPIPSHVALPRPTTVAKAQSRIGYRLAGPGGGGGQKSRSSIGRRVRRRHGRRPRCERTSRAADGRQLASEALRLASGTYHGRRSTSRPPPPPWRWCGAARAPRARRWRSLSGMQQGLALSTFGNTQQNPFCFLLPFMALILSWPFMALTFYFERCFIRSKGCRSFTAWRGGDDCGPPVVRHIAAVIQDNRAL